MSECNHSPVLSGCPLRDLGSDTAVGDLGIRRPSEEERMYSYIKGCLVFEPTTQVVT